VGYSVPRTRGPTINSQGVTACILTGVTWRSAAKIVWHMEQIMLTVCVCDPNLGELHCGGEAI